MKKLMQSSSNLIFVFAWLLLFAKTGIASNCPIIFLHGYSNNNCLSQSHIVSYAPQNLMSLNDVAENRIDSTLANYQRKDKTGAIIAEFLGASIGQAGLGIGIPYVLTKSISPNSGIGETIEASIIFLALYSIGAPTGASLGCIGTGKVLGQKGRTFGSVFIGALIGEAVGWGAQLLMAKIGNESPIFFFLPVSIGAVISYNKSGSTFSEGVYNKRQDCNIEKSFGWSNNAEYENIKKISIKFLEIKF